MKERHKEITYIPEDYTVIDTECIPQTKIITEIGAVKVRNKEIVDTWETLVNPDTHITSKFNFSGITDEDVKDAPFIEEIIDDFLNFVGDDVLVGHSIKSADLSKLDLVCGANFTNDCLCTLNYSRHIDLPFDTKGQKKRSLAVLADFFGFEKEKHRALSDCKLTHNILEKLREYPKAVYSPPRSRNTDEDDEEYTDIFSPENRPVDDYFKEKTIAITGMRFEDNELSVMRLCGCEKNPNITGVTKNTDILVVSDISYTSRKVEKAKEYGIKIIPYSDFHEVLQQHVMEILASADIEDEE